MASRADTPVKIAAAMACVAGLVTLRAQAPQPVFKSGVDVVRIDASVMNGNTPVSGLTKDHFAIVDNGVPQTVDSVSLDTVPLSLMLVLDTSESVAGDPLSSLIAAARGLIGSLRADESAALVTFSDQVRLAVPETRDRAPMNGALAALTAAGTTTINDAILLALLHRPRATSDTRPVMMVFSDGRDTASWLTGAQSHEAARRSATLIHVIELRTIASGTNFARELAKAGGGRVWSATSAGALRQLFGEVLNELRARYLISYTPAGVSRQGWHDVKLTLKNARGDITARPGYFVQ
jgi:Ca-activated chloride channel homolog